MTTPMYAMKPDFSPIVKMMAIQTRFAVEASQAMMKFAMLPWQGTPAGFTSICSPFGTRFVSAKKTTDPEALVEPAADSVEDVAEEALGIAETAVEDLAENADTAGEAVDDTADTVVETAAETTDTVVEDVIEPAAEETAEVVETAAETTAQTTEDMAETATETATETLGELAEMPPVLTAPEGDADDLTVLKGVGPKLAEKLHAAGIFHLKQIAAWSEANAVWVDENVDGVRGRASRDGWVAQAVDLAK